MRTREWLCGHAVLVVLFAGLACGGPARESPDDHAFFEDDEGSSDPGRDLPVRDAGPAGDPGLATDDPGTPDAARDPGMADPGGDPGTPDAVADPGVADPGPVVPLPGFGAITGDCGVLDDGEWGSAQPFLFRNAVDFGPLAYEPSLLTADGREAIADGNLGGSSVESEALAVDVLVRCGADGLGQDRARGPRRHPRAADGHPRPGRLGLPLTHDSRTRTRTRTRPGS